MNVTIPKSLEALVRDKVEEGHYSNEDEVVADALRLMQARDDVAAGRTIVLENEDQIDALFAAL